MTTFDMVYLYSLVNQCMYSQHHENTHNYLLNTINNTIINTIIIILLQVF